MKIRYLSVFASALSLCFFLCGCGSDSFYLVKDGRAGVAVVLADNPSRTALYAADELVSHIEKAAGARLPVFSESDVIAGYGARIFIGDTRAARGLGIELDKLGPDEFIIKTSGKNLFIAGAEDKDIDPLSGTIYAHSVLPGETVNAYSGALFGVYEILHRFAGVRWVWPGELGTYVPRAENILIEGALDERTGPKLPSRVWGWSHIAGAEHYESRREPGVRELGFTSEGIINYRDDLKVYMRRHRLGHSEPIPRAAHTFHWWWGRYGRSNPEWFMLKPDGERGPEGDRTVAAMCVSNPNLHEYIVDRYAAGNLFVTGWQPADRIKYAGYIPLGETDSRMFCQCDDCRAWDGDPPADYPGFAGRDYDPFMSNRYARFVKTIYDKAVKIDPDVKVSTYLYWYTFPAPTVDIELNENIWGEFTPWTGPPSYYPMPEEADRYLRQTWAAWRDTGMSIVYRPNYYHCGYVMPHLSTRQAGEFFRWAYQNGMAAATHDSLFAHFAVRGPMTYMLMRLKWDPELEVKDIRQEYFSAFGPAAKHIEEYFDYWEEYSSRRPGGWLHGDVDRVYKAFPLEVFAQAEKILREALSAAGGSESEEFAQRVEFLKAGLEHAVLASKFVGTLGHRGVLHTHDKDLFEASREALAELIEFRRAHEHLYIADFLDASMRENRNIDIDSLLNADFEDIRTEALHLPDLLEDPWGEWYFRKDPGNRGVDEKWHLSGRADENQDNGHEWMRVTVPAFLSETDAGLYLGYGWYSVVFSVPENLRGRTIALRFESVDEQAWVYVNGMYAGEHSVESEGVGVNSLWNRPFTIEVSPGIIKYGENNILMVRTHASAGQSGIWGEVRVHTADPLPEEHF